MILFKRRKSHFHHLIQAPLLTLKLLWHPKVSSLTVRTQTFFLAWSLNTVSVLKLELRHWCLQRLLATPRPGSRCVRSPTTARACEYSAFYNSLTSVRVLPRSNFLSHTRSGKWKKEVPTPGDTKSRTCARVFAARPGIHTRSARAVLGWSGRQALDNPGSCLNSAVFTAKNLHRWLGAPLTQQRPLPAGVPGWNCLQHPRRMTFWCSTARTTMTLFRISLFQKKTRMMSLDESDTPVNPPPSPVLLDVCKRAVAWLDVPWPEIKNIKTYFAAASRPCAEGSARVGQL